jgi:hypothetical protein
MSLRDWYVPSLAEGKRRTNLSGGNSATG